MRGKKEGHITIRGKKNNKGKEKERYQKKKGLSSETGEEIPSRGKNKS